MRDGTAGLGETIAAIASAPGPSRRAIVRLSGPHAFEAVPSVPRTRGIHRISVVLTLGNVPMLALSMPGPRSFTGEDCLELQVVSNSEVVRSLLALILEDEATRLAEPGEFTARAYLSGRLTLGQAEAVGRLVDAQSDAALQAASELASGRAGAAFDAWADEVASVLALVEAGIDFTDQEDVVAIAPGELVARLTEVRSQIRARSGDAPARGEPPLVALVGPPSAGKSTLFNRLLGRERAVVDEQPGTTRDALIEPLSLGGEIGEIRLMDLPGLDAQPDELGIQQSARRALARADVLVVCDPAGVFGIADDRPMLRVRTKADQPSAGGVGLAVCALDGWNIDVLRDAIAEMVGSISSGGEHGTLIARHRQHAEIAAASIEQSIDLADRLGTAPESIAAALRTALDELGAITGRITPDDVLGRVFSSFCVGK